MLLLRNAFILTPSGLILRENVPIKFPSSSYARNNMSIRNYAVEITFRARGLHVKKKLDWICWCTFVICVLTFLTTLSVTELARCFVEVEAVLLQHFFPATQQLRMEKIRCHLLNTNNAYLYQALSTRTTCSIVNNIDMMVGASNHSTSPSV